MSAEGRTCSSCGHGVPIPLHPDAVECHGAPPAVAVIPGKGMVAVFPQCHVSVSCGVWTAKGVDGANDSTGKTTEKTTGESNGTT